MCEVAFLVDSNDLILAMNKSYVNDNDNFWELNTPQLY